MRRISSIFLISAVLLAFGFGAFLMLHKDGEPHRSCVAGVIDGVQCKTAMTGVSAAILHLSALARPALIPSLAALAILLFSIVLFGTSVPPKPTPSRILPVDFPHSPEGASGSRKFLSWLSIHEKRDPYSVAAVNA